MSVFFSAPSLGELGVAGERTSRTSPQTFEQSSESFAVKIFPQLSPRDPVRLVVRVASREKGGALKYKIFWTMTSIHVV